MQPLLTLTQPVSSASKQNDGRRKITTTNNETNVQESEVEVQESQNRGGSKFVGTSEDVVASEVAVDPAPTPRIKRGRNL